MQEAPALERRLLQNLAYVRTFPELGDDPFMEKYRDGGMNGFPNKMGIFHHFWKHQMAYVPPGKTLIFDDSSVKYDDLSKRYLN